MTDWIPVAERLPERIMDVLAYSSEMHMEVVTWTGRGWSCDGNGIFAVLYWQPLPAPPDTTEET